MKKWFTVLAALALVVLCAVLLPNEAKAAEVVDSGTCGANVTWVLDSDGVLTISGTGAMSDYSYGSAPWYSLRSSIKTVTIKNGVTKIGFYAFHHCYKLTSVTIPDSVTSIGSDAFIYCDSLISVTIPDSVTSIDPRAFGSCYSLISVTIPDSVNSIGTLAFCDCDSLISVAIPNSVTSIGNSAFADCDKLTGIWVASDHPHFSNDSSGVLFNKNKTKLIQAPGALSGKYQIPGSVTSIGPSAFRGCKRLTSVTIPDSVTSIGTSSFRSCDSLTAITVSSGNRNFSSDTQGVLYNKDKTTFIQAPGAIKTCVIPDSVTSIGYGAFYYCKSLTSVTIPNGVTSIGDSAFDSCSKLTSVTIPNSVTSIGNSVFGSCSSLTSVTIPDSVTSIGISAFYDCDRLWHVLYTGTESQWNRIDIADGNDSLTAATQHYNCTGNEVVDAANKQCSICDAPCAHSWDNGTVTKPASCKETGEKTYTCSLCNKSKTESVSKLTTHTYSDVCDATCNVCGTTRTAPHQYSSAWSSDTTGHWHECIRCGNKKDLAAHSPGQAATEYTAQKCTLCDYVLQAPLGHTHNFSTGWACNASYHWRVCTGCGARGDETAHIPGVAATETTGQKCVVCDYLIAPALDPAPDEGTITPEQPEDGSSQVSSGSTIWAYILGAVAFTGLNAAIMIGGILIIVFVVIVGIVVMIILRKTKKAK